MVPPPKELFLEAVTKVPRCLSCHMLRAELACLSAAAALPRLIADACSTAEVPLPTAQVVEANADWVPPQGKGSLYLRPLLIGSGPILGLGPAPAYTLVREWQLLLGMVLLRAPCALVACS